MHICSPQHGAVSTQQAARINVALLFDQRDLAVATVCSLSEVLEEPLKREHDRCSLPGSRPQNDILGDEVKLDICRNQGAVKNSTLLHQMSADRDLCESFPAPCYINTRKNSGCSRSQIWPPLTCKTAAITTGRASINLSVHHRLYTYSSIHTAINYRFALVSRGPA